MSRSARNMHPDSFPLGQYEAALAVLASTPGNRNAQHQAVLSLARLGATDFAMAEYDRYGLDIVKDDEDIIALKGRLFKDLYVRTKADSAAEKARRAAAQYELAFNRTGGFYSAINAATMGYLAGFSSNVTNQRCQKILEILPKPGGLEAEEHYFIEATRAETYLLLGDDIRAERSLRRAFTFDPLNYTAHAATLRQFDLITHQQARNVDWLDEFNAPATLHFAGHIWAENDRQSDDTLVAEISDAIQRRDIGFAYGALAAGADIVLAETCLSEGLSLHVVLPLSIENFERNCVSPFGESWVARYRACLDNAETVDILPVSKATSSKDEGFLLATHICMGQTILRARDFERAPQQFLILDETRRESQTGLAGQTWKETGFSQTIFPINLPHKSFGHRTMTVPKIDIDLWSAGKKDTITLPTDAILDMIRSRLEDAAETDFVFAQAGSQRTSPNFPVSGRIFLSQTLAALIALHTALHDILTYAGMTTDPESGEISHWYTLNTDLI